MTVREYQKKRRRDRIFQAAMALFRERGFQETTATDIAKAAHVSRGTFFNYFPYKEAVLLDYGSLLLSRLKEEVRRRLAQGWEPLEVLRFLFEELSALTKAEKDLLLPLLYELLNPDPLRAKAAFQALPLGTSSPRCSGPCGKGAWCGRTSPWSAWAAPWPTSTSSPPCAGRPTPSPRPPGGAGEILGPRPSGCPRPRDPPRGGTGMT